MTTAQITALLDRYFDGQTTLAEEQSLRAYFAGPAVAPELAMYRSLFQTFAAEARVQPSAGFEARLLERLAQAGAAPAAPLRVATARRLLWSWQQVAAVLLVLGVSLWTIHQCSNLTQTATVAPAYNGPVAEATIDWSKYEVTDEAEALRITRAALGVTSKQLNQTSRQTATSVHTQLSKVLR